MFIDNVNNLDNSDSVDVIFLDFAKMQSTVILIMCQSQSMAPKCVAQRPQINAWLYTAYWSRGMVEYDG